MGGYLVAIDGSAASTDALRYAMDLAGDTGQKITAVHVVVPEEIVAADDIPPTSFAEANRDLILTNVEDAETHGQGLLDDASADRRTRGNRPRHRPAVRRAGPGNYGVRRG